MKTRKILGIVVLTLVLTLALGVAAYAATEVSDEAALRAALAVDSLSTNKNAPTEIVLTADITLTDGGVVIEAAKATPVYVNISGDYAITADGTWAENGLMFDLTFATMNLSGVEINGANKTAGFYLEDSTLNLKSGTTITKCDSTKQHYAATLSNAKLTIEDGVTISENGSNTTKNLFGTATATNTFTMTGGTVTGNTASNFFGQGDGHNTETTISGGEITDNVFGRFLTTRYNGGKTYLGSFTLDCADGTKPYIEIGSPKAMYIIAPLTSDIDIHATGGHQNANLAKTAIAIGSDYTLTEEDMAHIKHSNFNKGNHVVLYENSLWAYGSSLYNPPVGAIRENGTVVETQNASAWDIGTTGKGEMGVSITGQNKVKYDNAWAVWGEFAKKEDTAGVGFIFSAKVNNKTVGGSGMTHSSTVKIDGETIPAYADAYLDASTTITEDGATFEIIAALKGIPRNTGYCLWARPYVLSNDGVYYYGSHLGDTWVNTNGNTGEILD